MGQIVKQVSDTTTKYIWYPGDKREWSRAAVAIGAGAAAFAGLVVVGAAVLTAMVLGTSVTAALTGTNFGRRDARALAGFPDLTERGARRAAVEHTGRAAWRAMAQGFGGAAAAVLILNLPDSGVVADWVLPIVPAVVGALAHQAGMFYERLNVGAVTPGPAKAPSQA
ncbi:MAG TPA: hypothetical protein VES42_16740 [Pilimelia sp.]|nr:hypothetical protein [Pilimelia sp.]